MLWFMLIIVDALFTSVIFAAKLFMGEICALVITCKYKNNTWLNNIPL